MIAPTTKPNLYYLPTAEPAPTSPPVSRWTALRLRLRRGWWRARLTLAVRAGLWRPRRRDDDDYAALLGRLVGDTPAQLIDRRRSRPSRPATILDFESARRRLRPQTN